MVIFPIFVLAKGTAIPGQAATRAGVVSFSTAIPASLEHYSGVCFVHFVIGQKMQLF